MTDKKNSTGTLELIPNDQGRTGPSRRDFLQASIAGAGALVLQGAVVGAAQVPRAPAAAGVPALADSPTVDNWVQPITLTKGEPAVLQVVEVAPPPSYRGQGANETPITSIFTYNGTPGGPTVRMKGDGTFKLTLHNTLSGNNGNWAFQNATRFSKDGVLEQGTVRTPCPANSIVPDVPDWKLTGEGNVYYGPHMQNTTNFHSHGLHVRPGINPDGTHSDNVLMRVIPTEDYTNRMAHDPPLTLNTKKPEVVGKANFEFQIGSASGASVPTHPPGTHWYHPHPHGATYDQVAGGMAGFFIVEGDVDEAISAALTGMPDANPDVKTGDYDYRERLMLMQRIFDTGTAPLQDGEHASQSNKLKKNEGTINTVNGEVAGTLRFEMQAGAIERWRVLNGSVDGGGYVAFMVAKPGAGAPPTAPVKSRTAEAIAYNNALQAYSDALDSYLSNGVSMQHLAFDGVTLIPKTKGTGNWRHEMRDVTSMELAPANRSDFLFQAPSTPGAYTIYGVGINHKNLSVGTGYDESTLLGDGGPAPIVFATLNVTASTIPAFNISSIVLPDVPDNLLPVDTADLAGPAGGHRTRSLVYSGTGNGGYSCATGTKSTENGKNSMAIGRYNTTGDVGGEQKIIGGMKFDAVRPVQTMLLGSSEEWVLDNWSVVQGGMVDHPFHMHQNPFWVIAVFEPILDTNGHPTGWGPNLVEYPRWQDVVPIPRNGGRVIFRSRFPDYHGSYVNHCHLLQHEDWGMMQTVEVVTRSAAANNDWTETPYDPISNPNGPYQPTIRVTFEDMSRACQIFQSVPETAGGTPLPLSFCQP